MQTCRGYLSERAMQVGSGGFKWPYSSALTGAYAQQGTRTGGEGSLSRKGGGFTLAHTAPKGRAVD